MSVQGCCSIQGLRESYRFRPVHQAQPHRTAGEAHSNRSHSWKEGPLTRQKGGARSFGQEVGPDRSFLTLRKLRVADLLSFTLVPLLTHAPGYEGWGREVNE